MKNYVILLMGFLMFNKTIAALNCGDCSSACGPDQLICCAAQTANQRAGQTIYTSSEDYYNKVLFNSENLDGFCAKPAAAALLSPLQQYYYANFCHNAGTYYSYRNFLAAVNVTDNTNKQPFSAFACTGDLTTRYKELANFFTTIAQETTSVNPSAPYTNDGLYFRYENGALLSCSTSPNYPIDLCNNCPPNQKPCEACYCAAPTTSSPVAPYTAYYPTYPAPTSSNAIFADLNSSGETYTSQLSLGSTGTVTLYNISQTPETISFGTYPFPVAAGDSAVQLGNSAVLSPGLWVGMGPKQLTGQSMYEFFGWYQNNIQTPGQRYANFQSFITTFLNNGAIGFEGSLWYWMYRINGYNYRPIHTMVTDATRPVCNEIAAVTLMVNGGCNNYDPGRLTYFLYFNKALFQPQPSSYICTTSSDATPANATLNSLLCTKKQNGSPADLQIYCQTATSSGTCIPNS